MGNNKTSREGHVSLQGKQEQLREQRDPDEIKICVWLQPQTSGQARQATASEMESQGGSTHSQLTVMLSLRCGLFLPELSHVRSVRGSSGARGGQGSKCELCLLIFQSVKSKVAVLKPLIRDVDF